MSEITFGKDYLTALILTVWGISKVRRVLLKPPKPPGRHNRYLMSQPPTNSFSIRTACLHLLAVAFAAAPLSGCRLPWVPCPASVANQTVQDHLTQINGLDPAYLNQTDVPPNPDDATLPAGDRPALKADSKPVGNAAFEQLEIKLDDARLAAISGNLDLRVELVSPALAEQVVSEERGAFEKTFQLGSSWQRQDDPQTPPDTTYNVVSPGVNVPLTSGGQLQFGYDFNRNEPHAALNSTQVKSGAGLSLTQPLLRNFGYNVNTAPIQIACLSQGIASANAKLKAISVAAEVERAYWNLWSAHKLLEIARQQKELAVKQVDNAKRIVEAELLPAVEIIRAESGSLSRDNPVISAETDVRIAGRELKRIMQKADLPVNGPTLLTPLTEPNPSALKFDRPSVTQAAIDNRMELLQIRLEVFQNWITQEVQRNSQLPKLDLLAHFKGLGLDKDLGGSLEDLGRGKHGDGLVGLTLQVPLSGNISAQARVRQAELNYWLLQVRQQQQTVAIEQQVLNAIDKVEQNWRRVQATHLATEASRKTYEAEARLNSAGERTSTEVFLVLSNLADVQAAEIAAINEFQIAKVDLAEATGTVLGFAHIHWNPCQGLSGYQALGDAKP